MEIWDTSCPDWEARILSGQSLVPNLPLFVEESERALRVFKRLRVPDIFGNPTLGEVCPEWFLSIVGALFGSYDRVERFRYIQEVFLLIPKGNSKSSYGAPLMLTGLILNDTPAAEMDLISTTRNIADRIFDQIKGTIKLDDELTKAFHVKDGQRTIIRRLNDSELVVKSADTDVITGGKQLATFVDETHEFADRSSAAKTFAEIRGALGKRKNGFLLQATTQSKREPTGQFKSELENARAVRDGKRRDRVLPILYELPRRIVEAEEWKERKYWGLINPNLGKSISEDFLERALEKAEDEGRDKLQLVASQHFNVEIGVALPDNRWAGADYWLGAKDPEPITLESLIERCEVICVGVDGGGLDDLFAIAFVGRELGSGRWLAWTKSWCQASVLERRKSEASRLRDFEVDGDLTILDKLGSDIGESVALIKQVDDAGLLSKVGMDAYGVGAVIDALAQVDIGGDRVVAVPQGYKLMGAIKTAERKLADGTLVHAGQAIMAYAVGNAKVEPKGNAILITKQASGTAKIDPLMALFDAVALMSENPVIKSTVYSADRGLIVFG